MIRDGRTKEKEARTGEKELGVVQYPFFCIRFTWLMWPDSKKILTNFKLEEKRNIVT